MENQQAEVVNPGASNDAENKSVTGPETLNDERTTAAIADGTRSFQDAVRLLTDRALHFLSTASNEALGSSLVGLGAITYVLLGRVGLVLVGVVGGIILHATWESGIHGPADEKARAAGEKRRREVGLDVVHRVLEWRTRTSNVPQEVQDDALAVASQLYSGKQLDYSSFGPDTAAALNELTDAVIRDYVKYVAITGIPAHLLIRVFVDGGTRRFFPMKWPSLRPRAGR